MPNPRQGGSGSTGAREKSALNRLEAMKLRMAGKTYQQIGDSIGVSRSRAHRYVMRELDELRKKGSEAAAALRQLEDARLDELQSGLWPRALEGDVPAAHAVLRIMERRARLHGLDEPEKHEVKGDGSFNVVVALDDGRITSREDEPGA